MLVKSVRVVKVNVYLSVWIGSFFNSDSKIAVRVNNWPIMYFLMDVIMLVKCNEVKNWVIFKLSNILVYFWNKVYNQMLRLGFANNVIVGFKEQLCFIGVPEAIVDVAPEVRWREVPAIIEWCIIWLIWVEKLGFSFQIFEYVVVVVDMPVLVVYWSLFELKLL